MGSATPGSNEYTLDQVGLRRYLLDLRNAPPAARSWLDQARPTRTIGMTYPVPDNQVSLGRSYDLLIHLRTVTAAHPLL